MSDEPKTIASVEKTLKVVEALWKLDGAGVTELAEFLGLSKSTVHVHLLTLERKGYVVSTDGRYELGLRFLNFGEYVKRAQPLYDVAHPTVEDLAAETGELAFCMVEQEGLATAICSGAGRRAVQTSVRVGTHTYMHASSAGKAILAHLSRERVDEILDRWGQPRFTENTIVDRGRLCEELRTMREEGVFYSNEEYARGVASVGVPVLGESGEIQGAITVFGTAMRLSGDRSGSDLPNQLLGAANQIEVNMTAP
ncbi:IclR family transcriptional regulator [Halomarina litorea]|uniref:IclR family transcriptional regulator n=1 Tax=Halomarina litorea TaxID=2961595 RepID=UPI0020C2DD0F|nr:IclR family transcriptional regulator [Halomarina sp. BCD28]